MEEERVGASEVLPHFADYRYSWSRSCRLSRKASNTLRLGVC
jgi:hypothetical protein